MVLPFKGLHSLSPKKNVRCNNDKGTPNTSLWQSLCISAQRNTVWGQRILLISRDEQSSERVWRTGESSYTQGLTLCFSLAQAEFHSPGFSLMGRLKAAEPVAGETAPPMGHAAWTWIIKMYFSPASFDTLDENYKSPTRMDLLCFPCIFFQGNTTKNPLTQKQTHGSMKQNPEPGNKPILIRSINLWQRAKGGKTVSSTNGNRKTGQLHTKKNYGPLFSTIEKNKLKMY